jgi:hypothetical protein
MESKSIVEEMKRYLPVIEALENEPELWNRFTKGTGIATANGYRNAISQFKESQPTVICKDPHGHNMCLSKGFPCCQDCGGTNVLDAISESQPTVDKSINWKELRDSFFFECTDVISVCDGRVKDRKVNMTPHNLFEWFKSNIEQQQPTEVERMKWVKVEDRLPEIEGYYKVKYDDGTEDEKPFRIRPRNNIHGFMTMNIVTHWMDSTQNTQADEDVRDYEASDKPVIEHPCDAPLKDGATIEQRFQKQYEKCMLSLSDIIEEVQSLYELYKGVPKQ